MGNRRFHVGFRNLAGLFLILLALGHPAFGEDQARVEQFSPQGVVKGIRQVSVRFSGQMVAFGDPRLSDPFGIQCPEKGGAGGWTDKTGYLILILICPAESNANSA